jgi:hypothetical protein
MPAPTTTVIGKTVSRIQMERGGKRWDNVAQMNNF